MDRSEITEIILKSIDDVNEKLTAEQKIDNSADAVWISEVSNLDSLSVTFLIVSLENNFEGKVAIPTDEIMSYESSPLRSMQTLSDCITSIFEENK